MAKRKRQTPAAAEPAPEEIGNKKQKAVETTTTTKPEASPAASGETIQVVVGFYDGVIHGLTATINPKGKDKKQSVSFADTFLLTAHTRAIRCVAVSPPSAPTPGQTQKIILASGSNDSKINLYELSAHPVRASEEDMLRHVAPRPILENRKNKELGNLEHHDGAITALEFPSRSKLMSASEDSTISVTRTRDWALLGNIKAPIVKAEGRPSGDTATYDGTPQGVNAFAVHPSMKLMMSVSKGERKVRPWNLMTGKRSKALNYERSLLQQIGEGRHTSGEGKKLVWGNVDGEDEFAVGFDRDAVVFSMDGEPKCRALSEARTKVHQVRYFSLGPEDDESAPTFLVLSTEDGRIVFTSTKSEHLTKIEDAKDGMAPATARLVGFVGGKDAGVAGRIKDFVVVRSQADPKTVYVVGASSDGVVRVWAIGAKELQKASEKSEGAGEALGNLVGSYKTDNRVTCMTAYLMIPNAEGDEESDDDFADLEEAEESSGSEDSDDE